MQGASRWDRALTYLVWGVFAYVALLAANIAVGSRGLVPGYDGLSYVNSALRVNLGLMDADWGVMSAEAFDRKKWVGLPFTNTLDVLLLALLYRLLDYHVGIWLIHSAYIVLFFVLARRVLGTAPAALLFLWSVSNAFFLRQYTEFLSEMKVGMFLALFVACLFHEDARRHARTLFWVTVLLLLLRVINLLFVLPLAVGFAGLRWLEKKPRGEILAALQPVGLALLLLSPLLLHETRYLVPYIRETSYSDMARNWRDMAGVSGKWGLLKAYGEGLLRYNPALSLAGLLAAAAAGALHLTAARTRLASCRNYALAGLVVFAVLMQAQTNNVMLVYWVFMLLGLVATALAAALLRPGHLALLAAVVACIGVPVNYVSFARINRALADQRPLMELADGLGRAAGAVDGPRIFQNYFGIGQLDHAGIEVAASRVLGYVPLDHITYDVDLPAYLAALESANVAFIANRNFLWPRYVGINHKTEEIAQWLEPRAGQLGWVRGPRLHFDGNDDSFIDVYARPAVRVNLKYGRFRDRWLDTRTAVLISSLDAAKPLDGYLLELQVTVPGAEDPDYSLPLTATLEGPEGALVGAVSVNRRGPARLRFPLDGALPGRYRLVFDKAFTPKNDARKLSALYRGASLRLARCGAILDFWGQAPRESSRPTPQHAAGACGQWVQPRSGEASERCAGAVALRGRPGVQGRELPRRVVPASGVRAGEHHGGL